MKCVLSEIKVERISNPKENYISFFNLGQKEDNQYGYTYTIKKGDRYLAFSGRWFEEAKFIDLAETPEKARKIAHDFLVKESRKISSDLEDLTFD